jgi:hypothetical protein
MPNLYTNMNGRGFSQKVGPSFRETPIRWVRNNTFWVISLFPFSSIR